MLPEPEALEELLARHGAQASPWLQRQFGISQPSLSRVVARAVGELPALRRFGRGKSTVYALAGEAAPAPVWRITETGERLLLGELHALVRGQWLFAPAGLGTPTLTEGPPPWMAALPGCLEMGGGPATGGNQPLIGLSELTRDSRQQAAPHRGWRLCRVAWRWGVSHPHVRASLLATLPALATLHHFTPNASATSP